MKIENVDRAVQLREKHNHLTAKQDHMRAVQEQECVTLHLTAARPQACRVDAWVDDEQMSPESWSKIFEVVNQELAAKKKQVEDEIASL